MLLDCFKFKNKIKTTISFKKSSAIWYKHNKIRIKLTKFKDFEFFMFVVKTDGISSYSYSYVGKKVRIYKKIH